MFEPDQYLDLDQTDHRRLFEGCVQVWEALSKIKTYLQEEARSERHHTEKGRVHIEGTVFIGEGTVVEDGAMIVGPTIIGRNCQIRHNAYVRGNVLIGNNCVVGNATELKSAVLFNNCAVPHFNYVGDSILGYRAHLGAGVKISNVKLMPGNVLIQPHSDSPSMDTGLRKFGAILGDYAEVGCNSVLNPGTILGRSAVLYPCTNWRGVLEANQIAKTTGPVSVFERESR